MKYSDIITLQDYFHPVFNLQNEATDYCYCQNCNVPNEFLTLWISDRIIEVVEDEKELAGKALNVAQKEITEK
ncbi:hypothetical protein AGMMS50276_25000 [Synergistales bacterium]|nr:hypothetical protein AGMMS50276_25000 [Synergistales bacterium]